MDRNTPLGFPWDGTIKLTVWALLFSFLWSLSFFVAYDNRYDWLFHNYGNGQRILKEGVTMMPFSEIIDGRMTGFWVVVLVMVALAVSHYSYHQQGSKSIYLMKRLPKKSELWRRCLALPVVLATGSIMIAMVLRVIYFAFYMMKTPDQCLEPGQWIW